MSQPIELGREQRHPLADVVVEFAREMPPFGFLGDDEAASKLSNLPVAHLERRLVAMELFDRAS